MKKLYLFLKQHATLDLEEYLSGVSVPFRRFVLDNLERVEAVSLAGELDQASDKVQPTTCSALTNNAEVPR